MTSLTSEKVVVQAPMSFTGSARRIWKLTTAGPPWLKWAFTVWVALFLVAMAWMVIVGWYAVFGLVLWPYRLLRRGSRNRKRDELRHRELLAATQRAS